MSEEFSLEKLLPPGVMLDSVKDMLKGVDAKIEESATNYKFLMQMIGEDTEIPSADVLTLIIAQRYALHMMDWNQSDLYLPFLFARLTVKEVMR